MDLLNVLSKSKLIKHELSSEFNYIQLFPLMDVHIGDQNTDIKLFERFIQYIKAQPYRFLTLQGDLMNNAIKSSVSNSYNESMSPNEQKKYLIKQLREVKDRILCIVAGNHEHRSTKDVDNHPMEDIAVALELEKVYQENGVFLKITLGTKKENQKRATYNGLCVHGSGGGGKTGGAVNKLEDFAYSIEGLDFAIQGHTHKKWVSIPSKVVIDDKNEVIRTRPFIVLNGAAWQDYGGYAFRMMLRAGGKGATPLILRGDRKQIDVVMSTGNGVD